MVKNRTGKEKQRVFIANTLITYKRANICLKGHCKQSRSLKRMLSDRRRRKNAKIKKTEVVNARHNAGQIVREE